MAQEDEITFEYTFDFIFDELQDTFFDLITEFKKLGLKNKELKK